MKVKLCDAFDLQMGKTPSRDNLAYWNGIHKWISIGDLGNSDKYICQTKERISDIGVAESGIKLVPAGTVVMSFKLSIGKTAITAEDMYTNEAIMAFIDKKAYPINADYIYHLFSSMDWSEGSNKAVMGVTLNKATLSQKAINIPDINEQRRVALVLDKVNDLISLRKQQLAKLDELVKARFVEMFGDPRSNSKNWPQKRFDSLCENLDSRRIPITASERKAGEYPYYGASGIVDYVNDYIFDEDILLISEDGANLIARVTPIAFSVSGKVWVNNHAHVVRFKERCTQTYIEYYFALIDISDCITGSAQPKLNQAKLNAIMIPIPDLKVQERFYTLIKTITRQELTIQQSLDKLEVLKKSLMQEYFG